MFSSFRNRFGIPGVISVIALVFAMFGGAYAASNSGDATASAKKAKAKKGPRGPKGPKGATGAQGPAGAQGLPGAAGAKGETGAAGANGKDGTNGSDGANGANGKTILSGTATPTGAVGTLGDFYIETDVTTIYGPKASSGANGGWGTGTQLKGADGSNGENGESVEVTLLNPGQGGCAAGGAEFSVGATSAVICNGVNGSGGGGGSATQTGMWALSEDSMTILEGNPRVALISFSTLLPEALGAGNVHYIKGELNFDTLEVEYQVPEECDDGNPGNGVPSASNPEAAPGNLCVYDGVVDAMGVVGLPAAEVGILDPGTLFSPGAGRAGALISIPDNKEGSGAGTFAVTAPEE